MRKPSYMYAILVLMGILTCLVGCAPQGSPQAVPENAQKGSDHYVFANFQTSSEYNGLTKENKQLVKQSLEDVSLDAGKSSIEKDVAAFLENEPLFTLQEVALVKDHLSLYQGENRKPFSNMELTIRWGMDTGLRVGNQEIANELSRKLADVLYENLYYAMKVSVITIKTHSENGSTINTFLARKYEMGEGKFVEQDEEELQMQTIAYEYGDTYDFFMLQKFGIIEEESKLYLSFYVKDSYLEQNKEEDLRSFYDEIIGDFLAKETVQGYINKNELKQVTISFESGNFVNVYVAFDLPL